MFRFVYGCIYLHHVIIKCCAIFNDWNYYYYYFQLTVAKQMAEKRMQLLGGGSNLPHTLCTKEVDIALPGQKVFSSATYILCEKL